MTHAPLPLHKPLSGALLMLLSALCFSAINGLARGLSHMMPATNIMFWQNIFALLFLLPWVWGRIGGYWNHGQKKLHMVRVLISVIGVGLWYAALAKLQIAEAVALSFTSPIFACLGAKFFLKENVTVARWVAIAVCLLGALIILRPGSQAFSIYALLPLGAACAFACSSLLAKHLCVRESPEQIVFYLVLFMIPCSGFLSVFSWQMPNESQWLLLGATGVMTALAHFTLTKAYSLADASFLSPISFARLPFSAVIGFVFFQEKPDAFVLIGALIMIVALFILTHSERKYHRLSLK